MDVTVWRTSRSTIVRELLDYSTAVFDAQGDNLAQSARIPSHLNSMSHLLRELLDRHVDPAGWGPEDVVVTNDPYCGGQHLPDIVAFKPVFHEGRRIAFVGTLCHHIDVGGLAAGSYAADRKSTRLNSSHANISYAVFCLKKKKGMITKRATTTKWAPIS